MVCEIDGVDISAKLEKFKCDVEYVERYGSNGGLTLAGTMLYDLLSVAARVTFVGHPMKNEDAVELLTLCSSTPTKPTVQLTYFDPRLGAERTITAKPSAGRMKYAFKTAGRDWWHGIELMFEECG